MSEAQIDSFVTMESAGTRVSSNEDVLAQVKRMPGQAGTYKEVIAFIVGSRTMSAAEGNAASAPIIRALSELADEGVLDASEKVVNQETGMPNTVYRYTGKVLGPRKKEETWKTYGLRLEKELEQLQKKYESCCSTIDRQEKQLALLRAIVALPEAK